MKNEDSSSYSSFRLHPFAFPHAAPREPARSNSVRRNNPEQGRLADPASEPSEHAERIDVVQRDLGGGKDSVPDPDAFNQGRGNCSRSRRRISRCSGRRSSSAWNPKHRNRSEPHPHKACHIGGGDRYDSDPRLIGVHVERCRHANGRGRPMCLHRQVANRCRCSCRSA